MSSHGQSCWKELGTAERNLVLLWELHKLEVTKEIGNLGSFPLGKAVCEVAFVQGQFVFT